MTQALGIGVSSLQADTAAIDAVSENVANAQTPGYVSEAAQLSSLPGGDPLGIGDGVEVKTVAQANSALLSANNWQAQGALANLGILQQTLTAIENVFPLATQPASSAAGTSATSSASISGQLASFWSAWDSIAQNPSSMAPRTQIVDMAQSLVVSLGEASTQLTQVSTNAKKELTVQVSQVDNLIGQVASLNKSIVTTKGSGGNPNQLEDELRAVISTLSQLAGVDVRIQAGGTATVSIGGVTVVQDTTVSTLEIETTKGAAKVVALAPGAKGGKTGVTVPVGSGSIAGLLSGINKYVPEYQSQLNEVATALATEVNGKFTASTRTTPMKNYGLANGYTASGASGETYPLFVITGKTGGTAASTITVNAAIVANPALLAASATQTPKAAVNNGANAQAIAELGTTTARIPGTTSATRITGPDAAYQKMVQNIGADTQSVNNQLQAQTSVAAQAQQALQAITGVNVDQQLTDLLGFQQNYEASAKLLATVDATIQSLLQAV